MSAPEGPKVPEAGGEDEGTSEDSPEAVSPEEALELLPTEEEFEAEFDG